MWGGSCWGWSPRSPCFSAPAAARQGWMGPSLACAHAVLAHGAVCQPFAAQCGLIGTQGWPTDRRMGTQRGSKRVVVYTPALSYAQAATPHRNARANRHYYGNKHNRHPDMRQDTSEGRMCSVGATLDTSQQSVTSKMSPTTAVTVAATALRAPASGVTPDALANNL
jgi:hypothetical protein